MVINQNILNIILNTVTNMKTTEYVVEIELSKREREVPEQERKVEREEA